MDNRKEGLKRVIGNILHLPSEIKGRYLLGKIGKVGEDCRLTAPAKIIGGESIVIGDRFYAGPNCRIEAWHRYHEQEFMPEIRIGNDVKINSACHIGAINRIEIGNDVLMGSNVFITDHSHGQVSGQEIDIPPNKRDLFSKGEVVIGDNCWICENAIILPGVHIGRSAIVAAGAIVTKDVPERAVVAGNPAHVVKRL